MTDSIVLVMMSSRAVGRAIARAVERELLKEVVQASDCLMAEDWLQSGQVGVVLVNPSFDGEQDALGIALASGVPTVVLTGTWTPELDAEMRGQGAVACVATDRQLGDRVVDLVDKICGVMA